MAERRSVEPVVAGSTPVIHPAANTRGGTAVVSPVSAREWKDLPEWITTQEAVEMSGYDLQYVQRLARQGKIGAVKKGRDWWIDRDALRVYLEEMLQSDDGRAGPRIPIAAATP